MGQNLLCISFLVPLEYKMFLNGITLFGNIRSPLYPRDGEYVVHFVIPIDPYYILFLWSL